MSRKSHLTVAAIGGLTAAIALLSGLPSARADELSDLRANQQMLSRRIEQLEAQRVAAPPVAPAGSQATPGSAVGAGSFPRSFLIPGTDTSIRVGGAVTVDMGYVLSGATGTNGNNGSNINFSTYASTGFLTSTPVDGNGKIVNGVATTTALQRSRSKEFGISARRTSLNFETRTPTAWGEAKTLVELDFAGQNQIASDLSRTSNSFVPRLRYGYATLGGFLAGQANSNFRDSDSEPDLLDFGGSEGVSYTSRIPQLRYTMAGPYGTAFSVSAEAPSTDIVTPFGYSESDTNTVVTSSCGAQASIYNAGVSSN